MEEKVIFLSDKLWSNLIQESPELFIPVIVSYKPLIQKISNEVFKSFISAHKSVNPKSVERIEIDYKFRLLIAEFKVDLRKKFVGEKIRLNLIKEANYKKKYGKGGEVLNEPIMIPTEEESDKMAILGSCFEKLVTATVDQIIYELRECYELSGKFGPMNQIYNKVFIFKD